MQITQRFVVDHPREAVWAYFGRLEEITRCMPGAALTEPPVGQQAKFRMNVKVGPIAAAFAGDSELERDEAQQRGVIRGSARDTKGDSRVKGVVDYRLSEEDGKRTAVDISVDFTLTGRLAQFSRAGIVNDLAARFTEDFAKNLAAALAAEAAVAPPPASAVTAAAAAPATASGASPAPDVAAAPPAPRELDAGKLVLAVVWARIKRFFQSLLRRG